MTSGVASHEPTGGELLRAFLREWVSPFLRQSGFRQRGQVFRANRGENAIVIRFQSRLAFFTCNLAVECAYLIATATEWEPSEHWAIRLGPVALGYDKWWDLREDPASTAEDFLAALSKGLDYISPLSSDAGLRDAYLRQTLDDPRPMPPIHASQLARLIRSAGWPAWADAFVDRLGDA